MTFTALIAVCALLGVLFFIAAIRRLRRRRLEHVLCQGYGLAAVATLDASPGSVRVIIREIPATHWAAGDETLAERRATTAGEA